MKAPWRIDCRGMVAAVAATTCCLGAAAAVPGQPLAFERVFSERGEPASLHYRAEFRGGNGSHAMEVWRHGDRLRRNTDGAVEVHAWRRHQEAEFQLTVLDLKKRIATRIDRPHLNRIGDFTEWFDLAHGLKHPQAGYRLTRSTRPAGLTASPLGACDWYALTQGPRTTQVCWSRSVRLPLLMAAPDGALLWRVTQLDRRPPPVGVFEIHDAGFVRNDANQDIERD